MQYDDAVKKISVIDNVQQAEPHKHRKSLLETEVQQFDVNKDHQYTVRKHLDI